MPSLKIDLIVDDKGNVVINKTTQNLENLDKQAHQLGKSLATSMDKMHGTLQGMATDLQTNTKHAEQTASTFSGLSRSVLRLYAEYYVLSSAVQAVTGALMKGMDIVDQYNMSIVKMAAMMTGMMKEDGRSLGDRYKEAYQYAGQLNVMIEEVDKNTLLNARDLRQITEEMMKQGVVVDTNNRKQVEAFTQLSNALAVVSVGYPNKEIQLRQEIRALLTGQTRETDQLSKMLAAQIPNLKEEIELHKKKGDLLEWLSEQLIGFAAAQGDINASWEAMKSTLGTIAEKIFREGFAGAFRDILQMTKEMSAWTEEHKKEIATLIDTGWMLVKGAVDLVKEGIIALPGALQIFITDVIRLAMLLDKVGGTITAIGYAVTGFGATDISKQFAEWNKLFETRYKANDTLLTDMAMKAQGFKRVSEEMMAGLQYRPEDMGFTKLVTELGQVLYYYKEVAAASGGKIPNLKGSPDTEGAKKALDALLKQAQELDSINRKLYGQRNMTPWEDTYAEEQKQAEGLLKLQEDAAKEQERIRKSYHDAVVSLMESEANENKKKLNAIDKQEDAYTNKAYEAYEKGVIDAKQRDDMITRAHDAAVKARTDIEETEAAKQIKNAEALEREKIRKTREWLRTSNDAVAGVSFALHELHENQLRWGQAAYRATIDTFGEMKTSLGTVFFDAVKGDMDSFKDYWTSFTDAILKKFSDMLAQMAVDWLASQVFMAKNSLAALGLNAGVLSGMTGMTGVGAQGPVGMAGGIGNLATTGYSAYSSIFGGGLSGIDKAAMAGDMAAGGSSFLGSLTSYLGPAGLGFMGGSMMGSLLGGDSMGGGFGGAAGAVLGQMLIPIPGIGALIGGLVGSGLGSFAEDIGDAVGDVVEEVGDFFSDLFHDGGIVGQATSKRAVSPALFLSAPRLHNGLAPDEFPAILQRGERVIPRDEAGPEAVMPLTRTSSGDLGVRTAGGGTSIGEIRIYLDGEEIRGRMKIVADGVVVERNSRGINPTTRVYQ